MDRRKRPVSVDLLLVVVLLATVPWMFTQGAGATEGQRKDRIFGGIQESGIPEAGPWFQGWYTRITDSAGDRSIAVVAASQIPQGTMHVPNTSLPGYLAVILHEGPGSPTKIYEAFPAETSFSQAWVPLAPNSVLVVPGDFEWVAEDFTATVTQDMIDVHLPDLLDFTAVFEKGLPWNPWIPGLGPEGVLAFLSFLPLHWHVFSLGSDTTYSLTVHHGAEARTVSGWGYAHQETNLGGMFPPAWVWVQGVADGGAAQIALSGGQLDVALWTVTTWLVGFRSQNLHWDFRHSIPGTSFETEIHPCAGRFRLSAKNANRRLEVRAVAPVETFVELSVPVAMGFEPAAVQSFAATVEVSAYWKPYWGEEILVDEQVFRNAGLEFGADYLCRD